MYQTPYFKKQNGTTKKVATKRIKPKLKYVTIDSYLLN